MSSQGKGAEEVEPESATEPEPTSEAAEEEEAEPATAEPQPEAQPAPVEKVESDPANNNIECEPRTEDDKEEVAGEEDETDNYNYSTSGRRLPCIEQPVRCRFVSSRTGRRLVSTKDGRVRTTPSTKRKSDSELFLLLPDPEGTMTIRSAKFGRCLGADRFGGKVTAVKPEEAGDREKWCLFKPQAAEAAAGGGTAGAGGGGGCYVKSVETSANLSVNDAGELSLSLTQQQQVRASGEGELTSEEIWRLEMITGELCFLSNPAVDRRLRCDLVGALSLTTKWKGWEVWRLIEAGEGRVRINSWMHAQHFLCSDSGGKVMTAGSNKVTEGREGWDEWTAEKAPEGYHGVIIKSVAHGRILSFVDEDGAGEQSLRSFRTSARSMRRMLSSRSENSSQGSSSEVVENVHSLCTEESFVGERSVWQLESAHSQKYTLSCSAPLVGDTTVRSIGPFPFVTEKIKQAEAFRIDQLRDGQDDETVVTLHLVAQEKYLSSTEDGEVTLNTDVGGNELWTLATAPDGSGYNFMSKVHGRVLTHCGEVVNSKFVNGKLRTVKKDDGEESRRSADDGGGGREITWRLDPVLPRAVSSGKIKTFAIGTSIAVGTTVAMPFAMAGLVGIMGAQMGLLANMVTVGLTSAEAIASVGAIGTTAYLVFRESGDSLAMESDEVGEERTSKPYEKRPFCDWRSW